MDICFSSYIFWQSALNMHSRYVGDLFACFCFWCCCLILLGFLRFLLPSWCFSLLWIRSDQQQTVSFESEKCDRNFDFQVKLIFCSAHVYIYIYIPYTHVYSHAGQLYVVLLWMQSQCLRRNTFHFFIRCVLFDLS